MKSMIVRWGNSQGVRLPKEVLAAASLQVNDSVTIEAEKGRIVIEKAARRHRSLEERLAGFSGSNVPEEWDMGVPVGKEEL